jgi:hypothetical protein
MLLTEVILRLRACCPAFERRVGGTASFSAQTQQGAQFDVPYAFVVPTDASGDKPGGNAVAQKISEGFLTVICVDNSVSRASGTINAYDEIELHRRAIRDALVGWEPIMWAEGKPKLIGWNPDFDDLLPNSRMDTFRFVSGTHLSMNTQTLWHAFEWSTSFQDGPSQSDTLRGFTDAKLTGVQPVSFDKDYVISQVTSPSGRAYVGLGDEADYMVNPVTGQIRRTAKSKIPDGSSVIIWYDKPVPVFHTLLAGYFPEVLAAAGGDKSKITPEMYDLVSEVPEDALVVQRTLLGGQPGTYEAMGNRTFELVEAP